SYSALQMVFAKNLRSSFLAKPASCETLFSRTSMIFLTFAFDRREKKFSAVVLVKPMVKSFIPQLQWRCEAKDHRAFRPLAPVRDSICGYPAAYRRLRSQPPRGGTCPLEEF